ncbi:MAG: FHA domain-containing protein, partial [Desulfobacteraceae bacterium]
KVGRAGDNHLAFPREKTISGHHCEIFREGKDFFVRDLGSTNGVFVNGQKVTPRRCRRGTQSSWGARSSLLPGSVDVQHPVEAEGPRIFPLITVGPQALEGLSLVFHGS